MTTRLLRTVCALGLLSASLVANAQTVLVDSRNIVRFTANGSYGGPPAVALWSDASAACTASGPTGASTFIAGTSEQAVCTQKGNEALNAAYAAEGEKGPQSCYRMTAVIETKTCGTKLVCGIYGCQNLPVTANVCHITVTKAASFEYKPAFVLSSIMYELPGNASTVSYETSATNGSTWSTTLGVSYSSSVEFDFSLASGGYSSSTSYEKVDASTVSISASSLDSYSFAADEPDHYMDRFILWINPSLTNWVQCSAGDVLEYGVTANPYLGPQLPTRAAWMSFTAGELLYPQLVVDADRRAFLQAAQLTNAEMDEMLLSFDPFYDPATRTMRSSAPLDDKDRFRDIQAFATGEVCPRNIRDPISDRHSLTCMGTYSVTRDDSTTFNSSYTLEAKLKFLGSQPNTSVTVNYKRARTERSGHGNAATIQLATTTPGLCLTGQLAMDTLFNVYVASSRTYPCGASP